MSEVVTENSRLEKSPKNEIPKSGPRDSGLSQGWNDSIRIGCAAEHFNMPQIEEHEDQAYKGQVQQVGIKPLCSRICIYANDAAPASQQRCFMQ